MAIMLAWCICHIVTYVNNAGLHEISISHTDACRNYRYALWNCLIVYTLTPVDVPLNGPVRHRLINIFAPNMKRASIACVTLNGSIFNIDITDPNKPLIETRKRHLKLSVRLSCSKRNQYIIEIKNTGGAVLTIVGHAETTGNIIALSGQLILLVTGMIADGFGLKTRNRYCQRNSALS